MEMLELDFGDKLRWNVDISNDKVTITVEPLSKND